MTAWWKNVREAWSGVSLLNPFTGMLAIMLIFAAVAYAAGGTHDAEKYLSWAWSAPGAGR
jgi:hypothetical protein